MLVLGASGSGKTVYLASLGRRLGVQYPEVGFYLRSPLTQAGRLRDVYSQVADRPAVAALSSVRCGRWVSCGCDVGVVTDGEVGSRRPVIWTNAGAGVPDAVGPAGVGAPVAGRVGGRLRPAFSRILVRLRRAAVITSLAVALALRRWVWGRTLV